MKKYVLILISFVLTLGLSSCSDIYEEIIISDIEEYDNIWTLPERRVGETSVMFPNNVNEEQCVTFICKHTTYQLLGTGWQLLLEIRYDDSLYFSEIDRLNNLCGNSPIRGISEYFGNPAYATVWNWNGCFEYAVVDEKEKTVCYIYLQLIEEDNLILDKKYIPEGYEMQLGNFETYSIYE